MNHFQRIVKEIIGVDGILLTSEANCFYATGFMGEGMAVVSAKGCRYITDSRYTEAAQKSIGTDAKVVEINRGKPFSACVNDAISDFGIQILGFEDSAMTVAEYNSFGKNLRADCKGISKELLALRARKDGEEITALIAAQRIAEKAFARILMELRPGVTEKEIAARLQYLMLSYGADKMSFAPIVASGPNGSMPHAVPTERKIGTGDFVTMDFGCVFRGYCSDMTRTVCVGQPTDEMRQVYEVVLQAQNAGIAAAKAGVTGAAIDGAARKVIDEAGYGDYFGHSFGHGVGVEIHESPNASSANENPMPVGAVISAEPGIYLPGQFGVRIEDVLVLDENGNTDITLAEKTLMIL